MTEKPSNDEPKEPIWVTQGKLDYAVNGVDILLEKYAKLKVSYEFLYYIIFCLLISHLIQIFA